MRKLRGSILALLIHLTIIFNIERFDLDGRSVVNLETAFYGLTVMAIVMTLSIKGLKTLQQPILLVLWATAYFGMKLMLISQRPLVGDVYTYLSFTELGLLLIAVFLSQKLALNIEELEQAAKNLAFANISKIRRVEEAHGEIQAEIYRSRRFQRPLSVIVLEQDVSKVQTNIKKIDEDAQRALMEQYLSAMMVRELSAQLRQTDILLEHDKKGRFVIVGPDTDSAGTEAFIHRLKSLTRAGLFGLHFGTATFPNHALTFEQLLEHAEMNLEEHIDGRISVAAPRDSSVDSAKKLNVS